MKKPLLQTCIPCLCLCLLLCSCGNGTGTDTETTVPGQDTSQTVTREYIPDGIPVSDGVYVTGLFAYTGEYPEDGSFDPVENVAAIRIMNTSSKDIQYAQVTVRAGEKEYVFKPSTLMHGTAMTVYESSRAGYGGERMTSAEMTLRADFTEEPQMMKDSVFIQLRDGVVNVKNISDAPLSQIKIYIKNVKDGILDGGITYRVTVDTLEPGTITQLAASHVTKDGSVIAFVTADE